MSKVMPVCGRFDRQFPVGCFLNVLLVVAFSRECVHGEIERRFAPRYEMSFLSARTNWIAAPTNSVRAWEFARAAFDWAEFATNDTQRAQVAVEGIDAARKAIILDPKCAPAHYYLGMNLGQMARTKLLGALKLVGEMEDRFKEAAALDPHLDYAGPDRNLGILYREAPGWPASVGNRAKARTHLKRCVELSPDYPANHLELFAACLDWKDIRAAEKMMPVVERCLQNAKIELAGTRWEWSWSDWDSMWRSQQSRFKKLSK